MGITACDGVFTDTLHNNTCTHTFKIPTHCIHFTKAPRYYTEVLIAYRIVQYTFLALGTIYPPTMQIFRSDSERFHPARTVIIIILYYFPYYNKLSFSHNFCIYADRINSSLIFMFVCNEGKLAAHNANTWICISYTYIHRYEKDVCLCRAYTWRQCKAKIIMHNCTQRPIK